MPVARILYARSATIGGWVIRNWPERDADGTRIPAKWSHQAILLRDDDRSDEPVDLVWHATWPKGFHCETYERFYRRYAEVRVATFEVEADFAEQAAWCEARKGQRYAIGTLLGLALGISSPERRADHCAEACENALTDWRVRGGPRFGATAHHLISPNRSDFNRIGRLS